MCKLLSAEASRRRIVATQRALAGEGIWVEPASAAGVAGLINDISSERLKPGGKRIVAVCTGHGMKDPQIITQTMLSPIVIDANYSALVDALAHGENNSR